MVVTGARMGRVSLFVFDELLTSCLACFSLSPLPTLASATIWLARVSACINSWIPAFEDMVLWTAGVAEMWS